MLGNRQSRKAFSFCSYLVELFEQVRLNLYSLLGFSLFSVLFYKLLFQAVLTVDSFQLKVSLLFYNLFPGVV